MKFIHLSILLLLNTAVLTAQSEFRVNSYLDSAQHEPAIARDASGNYVVVWTSESQVDSVSQGDIFLQLFDNQDQMIGGEIQVNSHTASEQEKPAVDMAPGGEFVVVWASVTDFTDNYDIYGQIFRNNSPFGSNFRINTEVAYAQSRPDLVMYPDGRFIVVWDSWFQDGSDRGVFGQRFTSDGLKNGPEFSVNTTTAYSQARPSLALTGNGEFVVIWESWKQDIVTLDGYGLFGQRFDAAANKIGGEFQINTYTNDYQWLGDILGFDDGSFVVAWCSWEQDGDDGGIYLQRFGPQGSKSASEIRINSSTAFYQWLPRFAKLSGDNFAVIWSSWKQDGDREGVYAKIFDRDGKELAFESRINLTTQNFQWEPVAIGGSSEMEIVAVWSSCSGPGIDYDVIARRMELSSPTGYMNPNTVSHPTGRTTSEVVVHVFDSTAVTGESYQVTFQVPDSLPASMNIQNLSTSQMTISDYTFYGGAGFFYLTPVFEGIAVEIKPVFELDINTDQSHFINHTGSNLSFDISAVNDNLKHIVPINVVLVWGSTDTLPNGRYATPLDTAMSIAAKFEVQVPFRAWDLTENQPLGMWVIETSGTYNQRWDPHETIRILTPPPNSTRLGESHAQVVPVVPTGTLILPGISDSIMIYTQRPLTDQDTIRFVADPSGIITGLENKGQQQPLRFSLENNYPNPFNPATTIPFTVDRSGRVKLTVYNILGQKVATLQDGYLSPGRHRALFNAAGLASGIYLYNLARDNYSITRKMILLK